MEAKLVMFKSNGQRKEFPLAGSTTVIGRAENCDLRVPLLSVSRRHTQLTVEEDQLICRDMGSSNGTYVNNERVTEAPLNAGDRLVVGPIVFTVQIDGKPEEIRPVKTRGQKMAEAAQSQTAMALEMGNDEEIVDLESEDVFSGTEEDSEIDPIAALEALAEEEEEEEEDEENA